MKKRKFHWLNTVRAGLPALIATIVLVGLSSLSAKAFKLNYEGLTYEIIGGNAYIAPLDNNSSSAIISVDKDPVNEYVRYEPTLWFNILDREVTVPETITDGTKTYTVRGFYVYIIVQCNRGYDAYDYHLDLTFPETVNLPSSCNTVYYYMHKWEPHNTESIEKIYPLFTFLTDSLYRYINLEFNKNFNFYGEGGTYASLDGIVYNSDFSRLEFIPRARTGEVRVLPDVKGISGVCATGTNITKLSLFDSTPAEIASRIVPERKNESDQEAAIESSAFKGCTNLTEIAIPNGVLRIDDGAFENCTSLKKVTTTSIKEFGLTAFAGCRAFDEFATPTDASELEAYQGVLFSKGLTSLIKAPNVINSLTLPSATREVAAHAFLNNSSLKDITLNEGLEKIGSEAFANVSNLNTITFPSTLKEIEEGAFKYTGLNSVTLNEDLEKIGSEAFANVSNLNTITFPSTLKEIEEGAFKNTGLNSVTLNEGLEKIGSEAFACNDNLRIITIPSTLKEFGENVFKSSGLVKVTLNEGLERIPNGAFAYTRSLNNITFPSSLKEIGDNAFKESALVALTFNAGLEKIGDGAFSEVPIPSVLTFPESLTEIGNGAFQLSSSMGSSVRIISFPKALRKIGSHAFYKNNMLELSIPSQLEQLGEYAFASVTLYTDTELEIPSSLREVASHAFYGTPLSGVKLCDGIKCVGDSAFYSSNISELTLNNDLEKIGDYAFFNNPNITNIDLPESLNELGAGAFALAFLPAKQRDIKLPKGLTTIEPYTFQNNSINTLIWPEELKLIGNNAFYSAAFPSNYTLEIPTSVSEIEFNAFDGKTTKQINTLILHKIAVLGSRSFAGLFPSEIECISWFPPKMSAAFNNETLDGSTLYVPTGADYYYKMDGAWKKFRNIVCREYSGVQEVGQESANNISVVGNDLMIEVGDTIEVSLYTIDGRTLYSGQGACTLTPGKGIFIVRIGTRTIKICI